jgi:BCD family chlorophyll transporter-like MFS transporter
LFAAPLDSAILFGLGTTLIGIGGAMFAVGTLLATIALAPKGQSGLALGAWGGVQAFAAGAAIAAGGIIRDIVGGLASSGTFGATLSGPATGYGAVYQIEIIMLFATLVALGPLVRPNGQAQPWRSSGRLDLAGLST